MRQLTKFQVVGLLGQFDHTISFSRSSSVTILYGPNGVGKTKVLDIISSALQIDLGQLSRIPFDEATLSFNDGHHLVVTSSADPERHARYEDDRFQPLLAVLDVTFTLIYPNGQEEEWSPRQDFDSEYGLSSRSAQQETLAFELSRATEREYLYALERNLSRYRQRDVYNALRHRRPELMAPPEWLRKYCDGIASHMIETQRLVVGTEPEEPGGKRRSRSAVQEYREDLAKRITDTLAENSKTAARLDRTFPRRIMLDEPLDRSVTDAKIRSAFETQRKKRAALSRVGLADNAEELPLPDRDLEQLERKVLWTYLADMDQKLQTFDALLARLERFVDIVNSKFLYKHLQIDPDLGFTIETTSGRAVPPDGLSSGEQHELVLAYNLLFKTVPGSLVLIDEPEISLHVVWQQQFISDLEKVTEVVPMQFVIATHSPQIINKWWDRAIALEPDPSLFA